MSTLSFLIMLLFLYISLIINAYAINLDIRSFGIIIDNNEDTYNQPVSTTMTLYWQQSSFECTILASQSNHFYECNVNNLHSKQQQLQSQTSNKLHIDSNDTISIKSIIIIDEDHNQHTMNSFCSLGASAKCEEILQSVSSTTIQLPTASELIQSPNTSHQCFIQHQSILTQHILARILYKLFVYTGTHRRLQTDADPGSAPTDIDYITFTLSNLNDSGQTATGQVFRVDIFWDVYHFYCGYNFPPDGSTLLQPGDTKYCFSNDSYTESDNGDIIPGDSFYIRFFYQNGDTDLVRIASLRAYLNSGDYFEINGFCLPTFYNQSGYIQLDSFCPSSPHKLAATNLPITRGPTQSEYIDRPYVYFPDAIRNNYINGQPNDNSIYFNQAFDGNIRMAEPTTLNIRLSDTTDAGVDYTLYWDEQIIKWTNVISNTPLVSLSLSDESVSKNIECNHESQYMLHVYNPGNGNDPITIQNVTVSSSDTHAYSVETFCIANSYTKVHVGSSNSACSNDEFGGIPQWDQVCVGDGLISDLNKCSDQGINIVFPQNLFLLGDQELEGRVINGDQNIPATCSPTPAPTKSPTVFPTKNPTADPTFDPTNDPTMIPTKYPSVNPTTDPTKFPSTQPTRYPSLFPSVGPTKDPTFMPTESTPNPTMRPSEEPSIQPTDAPIVSTLAGSDGLDQNDEESEFIILEWFNESDENKIISAVGLGFCLLVCCLVCYIFYVTKTCCFLYRKKKDHPESVSMAALKSQSPQSTTSLDVIVSNADPTHSGSSMIQLSNTAQVPSVSMDLDLPPNPNQNKLRSQSSITIPHRDEFIVTFKTKPFGINMSTIKSDKYNLYVTKVNVNSVAMQKGVVRGTKLVALNGESIEGIGAKAIFDRLKKTPLPLDIMFRRRDRRKSSIIERNQSGEVYQSDALSSESELYEPGTPELIGKTQTMDDMNVISEMNLDSDPMSSPNDVTPRQKSVKKEVIDDKSTSSDDDDDDDIYDKDKKTDGDLLMNKQQTETLIQINDGDDLPSSDEDEDEMYKKVKGTKK